MGLQTDVALQELARLLGGGCRVHVCHGVRSAARGRLQEAVAVDRTALRDQRLRSGPVEHGDLRIERVCDLVGELAHENLAVAVKDATARQQMGGEARHAAGLHRQRLHAFRVPGRDYQRGVVAGHAGRAYR